jgi:hypothetical protein
MYTLTKMSEHAAYSHPRRVGSIESSKSLTDGQAKKLILEREGAWLDRGDDWWIDKFCPGVDDPRGVDGTRKRKKR